MLVHTNKKFIDNGDIYEIVPDFDRSEGITTYTTYLYDEDGILAIAGTNNSQEFPHFYRLGWTKAEVKADLKDSWTIVKERYIHLDDLRTAFEDEELEDYFDDLKTWTVLPTEEAFVTWLYREFIPAWEAGETNELLTQKVETFKADIAQDSQKIQIVEE